MSSPVRRPKSQRIFPITTSFYISTSIPAEERLELTNTLIAAGAEHGLVGDAQYIVSDTPTFDGWQEASKDAHVVTREWVDRSIILQTIQQPQGFSCDPRMIFSGVVASATDLPAGDKETMRQAIVAFGGQWREAMTRDVTHLFCLTAKSERYEKALAHRNQTGVIIVLPHWFDDMYNARRRIPTELYEWPNPKLFERDAGLSSLAIQLRQRETGNNIMFKAIAALNGTLDEKVEAPVNVWDRRRVYLSRSLDLHDGRRATVESLLVKCGAQVVSSTEDDENELNAIRRSDVLITRYRDGPAFGYALKTNKVIGTLGWALHVSYSGKYSSSLDRLLHFPSPAWPVKDFHNKHITITNYSGGTRDYLRKLVELMGGHYTPTMSSSNTHLIAATLDGRKTERANSWNIPVLNHTWLEDCFLSWDDLHSSHPKYLHQAHGMDWTVNVGEIGIGKYSYEHWEREQKRRSGGKEADDQWDQIQRLVRESIAMDEEFGLPTQPDIYAHIAQTAMSPLGSFAGTNASFHEAKEVEDEIMAFDDGPADGLDEPSDAESSSARPMDLTLKQSAVVAHASQHDTTSSQSQPTAVRKKSSNPIASARTGKTALATVKLTDSTNDMHDDDDDGDDDEEDQAAMDVEQSDNDDTDQHARGRKRARETRATDDSQFPAAAKRTKFLASSQAARPSDFETQDESQQRRSGRAAAEKANKVMSQVLVPDMLQFQTKEKRGKREERRTKANNATVAPAGRKASRGASEAASDAATDDGSAREDSAVPRRDVAKKQVHYMTTLVEISKEQTSSLAKLGAKAVVKPDKITHVIADRISKTQKFLSAMNYAPFYVTPEWVKACVQAKQLVSEGPYLLVDRENEKKFGFKLQEAVGRAKQLKGTLLKGYTFFTTPNATTNIDLAMAVVVSAGGELKDMLPTTTRMKPRSFLISSEEDAMHWKKMPSATIYKAEMIFMSVLKQQLPDAQNEEMILRKPLYRD